MKLLRSLVLGALGLVLPLAAHADTIKIGLMCPLTGSWASEGQDMKQIVSLLADEVNAAGGINGRQLELVVEDDGGDPRTAALAAQKLAIAGVSAVIGTYGSAVTEAAQSILDESEILHIATGATSVRLTEKGMEYFFRTSPRDDEQGRVAAQYIKNLGYGKIAIVHDNSSYSKGLAEETRAVLEEEGVQVVFFDALTPKERDYSPILTRLRAAEQDLFFYPGYYPEAGLLLRQEKQMRREYAKQQTIGPVLSLDAIRDGGSMDEAAWLLDTRQSIDSEVLTAELTDTFCKTLTDSQRSIFRECLIEGKSQTAYAAEHGISVPMVNKQIRAIRGKAKIYFS